MIRISNIFMVFKIHAMNPRTTIGTKVVTKEFFKYKPNAMEPNCLICGRPSTKMGNRTMIQNAPGKWAHQVCAYKIGFITEGNFKETGTI